MSSPITSTEDRKIRVAICDACEYRIEVLSMKVCEACRCPISSKVIITAAKCPHNRWPSDKQYIKPL